jgi:hypothetical protein
MLSAINLVAMLVAPKPQAEVGAQGGVVARPAEGEGKERDGDQGRHHDDDGDRAAVFLGVRGRAPGDQHRAGDDRHHSEQRLAVGLLPHLANPDRQQDEEAGGEQRLDHDEGRVGEG